MFDVRFAVDFHEAFEAHAHEAVRSAGAAVHGMLAGVPGVGVPEHGGGDADPGGDFHRLPVEGDMNGRCVLHGVVLVQHE